MSVLGPRGMTVLTVAGVAGLAFGIMGWTQRGTGLVTGSPAVTASAPAAVSPPAAVSQPPSPAVPGSVSPSAAAGPPLSGEPFASFAYQVWPGPVGATAKLALSGWTLTVTRRSGGIAVQAALDGRAMPSVSHFYPGGAKVYALDSNVGDDTGGATDYNETDDGLVVTNAQGQVLG